MSAPPSSTTAGPGRQPRAQVRLEDVVTAVICGHARYDHRVAGWIVLQAAERLREIGGGAVGVAQIALENGDVVLIGRPKSADEETSARALRDLLETLLQTSASSTPNLRLCACRPERTGLELLVRELTFALGNVDRDAMRRLLVDVAEKTTSGPTAPAPEPLPVSSVPAPLPPPPVSAPQVDPTLDAAHTRITLLEARLGEMSRVSAVRASEVQLESGRVSRAVAERDAALIAVEAARRAREEDAKRLAELTVERERVRLELEDAALRLRREIDARDHRIAEIERRLADAERGNAARLESLAVEAARNSQKELQSRDARIAELEGTVRRLETSLDDATRALNEAARRTPDDAPRAADAHEMVAARRRIDALEEQNARLSRDRDAALASATRTHEELLSKERQERDRALADLRAQEDQRLASTTAAFEQRIAAMRDEHAQALASAAKERDRRVDSERAEAERRVAEIEARVSELESQHREALVEARAGKDRALSDLAAAHARAISEANRKQIAALGDLEARHRAQVEELEARVQAATEEAARAIDEAKEQRRSASSDVWEQRITALRKEHAQALALQAAEKDRRAAEERAEAERRIADLESRLAEIEALHQAALIDARGGTDRALSELQANQARALAEANKKHAAALAELEARHRAQIEQLEARHRAAESDAQKALDTARGEAMRAGLEARTEILRERDAMTGEAERRHTRELQAALARLRRTMEEEAERARADAKFAHDGELATVRAELDAMRARLESRANELEQSLFRALAERDAERALRLDVEALSAKRLRALRTRGPVDDDVEPPSNKIPSAPPPNKVATSLAVEPPSTSDRDRGSAGGGTRLGDRSREDETPQTLPPIATPPEVPLVAPQKPKWTSLAAFAALGAVLVFAAARLLRSDAPAAAPAAAPPPPVAPSSAPKPAPAPAVCAATLTLQGIRPGTEVLRRGGRTPLTVRVPARVPGEIVLTHEGYAPRRLMLDPSAPWKGDTLPTLTLEGHLDGHAIESSKDQHVDATSPWPTRAGAIRAPVVEPSPGLLHVTSDPDDADVWLDVDPSEIRELPCGAAVELLLVAPLGTVDHARIEWSEFKGAPPRATHKL